MPSVLSRSASAPADSRAASVRRLAFALGLSACAAAALWLTTPHARAAEAHAPDAHAAPAAAKVQLKPDLKAEAHAAKPAAAAKPAPHAEPAPTPSPPSAKSATGDLEALRQRLNDRVAQVRQKQSEVPTVHLVNRAPASRPVAALHAGSRAAGTSGGAHATGTGHEGHAHWDYAGENGPEAWGRLKPEFATCSTGQRQSPIDIREGVRVDLDPIQFDYRATGFNVVDNGHTVQVNVGAGNFITVGTRRFELVQFHFHRPSEERINGRQFEMVAHLVHKDLDGKLAVVAVLMDQGRQHPLVQQVWNNLPLEKNVAQPSLSAMDLNHLLPEDRRYYTYMGSLTTPPCSEGVLWLVMKQPATMSHEQLAVFARLYPMNARPIQRVSDRLIKESN